LNPICISDATQKAAVRAVRQDSWSVAGTAMAYMKSETFIMLKK
jgi:hypothetical protein